MSRHNHPPGSRALKERELRAAVTCAACGRKLGATGTPLFWRLRIERFGLNAQALRRQHGLGLQIGGALAQIMGPDEDLAIPVMSPVEVTVCEPCGTDQVIVAMLVSSVKDEQQGGAA